MRWFAMYGMLMIAAGGVALLAVGIVALAAGAWAPGICAILSAPGPIVVGVYILVDEWRHPLL